MNIFVSLLLFFAVLFALFYAPALLITLLEKLLIKLKCFEVVDDKKEEASFDNLLKINFNTILLSFLVVLIPNFVFTIVYYASYMIYATYILVYLIVYLLYTQKKKMGFFASKDENKHFIFYSIVNLTIIFIYMYIYNIEFTVL